MFKKLIFLSIAYLAINIGVSWAETTPLPPAKSNNEPVTSLNRIVAIVNDEIIPQSELDTAVDELKQQITASNLPMPSPEKLRDDALQQLINYHLQLQMVERNDIKPTSAEVDQAIEQIAKSHNLTVDQLKEQLALQNNSYEEFRQKISEQFAISKLQQQMVAGQVKITDDDITAFKNSAQGTKEYKLVDFFLPLPEQPTTEDLNKTLATAREIQQKLENGADIDTMTPVYQDLGWRTADNLPEIFAEQLPKLTLKNASTPLHAPNGYHVLKLVDMRNTNQTLTDDQIRQIVMRQKYEAAVKAAIDKARGEAYIQIIPQ